MPLYLQNYGAYGKRPLRGRTTILEMSGAHDSLPPLNLHRHNP
jgi:hypothetical protein